MAVDVIVLPSSDLAGGSVAGDRIDGNFFPYTKLIIGADGVNDGDVSSANPLPVTGTVTANLGATDNAVLDSIAAAVEGTLTVDTHHVTNAGTFAVQAAQSGTWTVALGATDNAVLDAIAASTAAIEAAVEGTLTVGSHAVTNAGTFAVQAAQSGTWTVELGATDNAVLDAIAASVAGTLTVGAHAVTNAGTFAVQENGAALTALQLIDNVIYVDNADWTATSSSHALVGGVYQSTPGTITDGDTGPLRLTANGAAHVAVQNTVTVASHAVTNAGTFAVQAAQSGTWTVDLGATDNAVLDAIAASLAGTLTVGSHAVTNAGTFAVQSTLQAGTAYAGKVRLTDGTTDTDIRDLANSNALNVAIVDSSGDQITSFGGGTQYAVDAALGANPTGTLAVAIRDDALSALTPVEGDAVGVRVDANGALWVIPSGTVTVSGTVTANLSATDNAVLDAIEADTTNIAAGFATEGGALGSGVLLQGDDGTNRTNVLVDTNGHLQIDVLTSGLPSGAATAANQTTLIGHVDGLEGLLTTIAGGFAAEGAAFGLGLLMQGDNGTTRENVKTDADGHLQVDVLSSALPTGAATSANQSTANTALSAIQTAVQTLDNAISGSEMQVDVVAALPTGTNTIGVVMDERVSTATVTSVSGSATSVQLLASTAGRKGASFYNDSTAIATIKHGTTASSTSLTLKLLPGGYTELPQPIYTGRIDCIWEAANGAMRITEYT